MKKYFFLYIFILVCFFISRVIFFQLGVHFDTSPLTVYLQTIDLFLLKNKLFESIFFLHCQPPLFNLFVGIILKAFPHSYPVIFHAVYLSMGATLMVSIFILMKKLGVHQYLSAFLAFLFMIKPSVIIYENLLFYPYPSALLLSATAFYFHRYLTSDRLGDLIRWMVCLMLLVLLVGTFHFFWFMGWIAILMIIRKAQWRMILKVSLVPLIIILSIYLKNYLISGQGTLNSTWLGVQMARMTFLYLTEKEYKALKEERKIDEYTFKELNDPNDIGVLYQRRLTVLKTGIGVLDQKRKRGAAVTNYNSLLSLKSSSFYRKDALNILKEYPHVYIRALRRAYFTYCLPGPTDYHFSNREYIRPYERVFNFMFYQMNHLNGNDISWYSERAHKIKWDFFSRVCFNIVAGLYVAIVLFGFFKVIKLFHVRKDKDSAVKCYTLLFILGNIVYVTIVYNALESLANNRYRFIIDPFYVIVLGMAITSLSQRLFKRKGAASNDVMCARR